MVSPTVISSSLPIPRDNSAGASCSHRLGVFDDYLEHCHRSCSHWKDWDKLLFCVQQNDLNQVKSLILDHGVSPTYSNPMKQSALHIAAGYGHVECLEFLLHNLSDVDDKDQAINAQNRLSGATPLHCCLQKSTTGVVEASVRRMACVHLLMQAGARTDIPDAHGKTALDYWKEQDLQDESLSMASLHLLNNSNQIVV